jgi:class 3 adenylate cyclase/tetratricopeptide (TPR) repeat protein
VRICASCGRENPEGFGFCGYCRSPLGPKETLSAGVRKTVTVVFCDVTGSTSLGEQLDPESMRHVMSRFFEEMKAVLERHGGTVEKFIGDAVMAVFGIPSVHEDDALRAVRAAAEMRDALATLNKELERDRGVTIASRIGVNTGEVVAGDPTTGQALVTGDAVNVAARLEQAAAPGEILIGETTMRLVPDAVVAEAVEPLELKGKAAPVAAFRLEHVAPGAAGVARHLDAPMIGRERELRQLREAFEGAVRERRCRLATLLGAAGVGKSRLTEEFVAGPGSGALVLRGQCLSYGDGITYWPIVEMVTAVAGIGEVDDPAQVRAKIEALFGASPESAIAVERLAQFLGLAGAAAAPEETNWAVRKLFEALAGPQPVVAVFEDIHWAEPALLDLIEHITERSTGAPILLLCTARPELLDERAVWGGIRDATSVLLERLSGDECGQMIANLLGKTEGSPEATRRITEAAEGNPLFVEQMVAMLIDDGLLRKDAERWVVAGDLATVPLPATITGLLEARLDRLSPDERAVIERASVEGRVFHWGSVTLLSSDLPPDDVSRHLRALVRRDLIGPDEAVFGGSEAFRFRHALIRDAAYERMPKETRAELHERHARWLEEVAGEHAVDFEEVLAYHLEQAYRLRSELGPIEERGRALAAEAARRLASGGRRAVARGDMRAASTLLDRAVTLLGPDDPNRIDLLVLLGTASIQAGDLDRAAEALDQGLDASIRMGDRRREIRARLVRFQVLQATRPEGVTEQIKREAEAAIPALEELGDDEGLARAWNSLCEVGLMWCHASDMEIASERAVFHAERAGDRAALSDAVTWRMFAPWLGMDRPEVAIRRCDEMRAKVPDDRLVEAFAELTQGFCDAILGHFDEGRRKQRRGQNTLIDLGLKLNIGGLSMWVGGLEFLAGDLEAAERAYREGAQMLESIGEIGYLSTQVGYFAQVLFAQGRFEEAAEKADLSERLGATDDVVTQTVWRQVRAKLLAREGLDGAAVALAEAAVAMTDGIDGWDTLESAFEDLGEVYRLVGRRDDATRALGKALDVCERKGAIVVAERVRSKIDVLDADPGT